MIFDAILRINEDNDDILTNPICLKLKTREANIFLCYVLVIWKTDDYH